MPLTQKRPTAILAVLCLLFPLTPGAARQTEGSLVPVTSQKTCWNFNVSGGPTGALVVEDGALKGTITGSVGNRIHVSVETGLKLKPGKVYRLHYAVRADAPHEIAVYVLPWNAISYEAAHQLTTKWLTVDVTFQAKDTLSQPPWLAFFLGHDNGSVWIKDVALSEISPAVVPVPNVANDLEQRIAPVLPHPGEDSYREVPWRLDFAQARKESMRTGKPLYIWLMNGHPLGFA